MIRHILTLIWNERRSNAWIFIEYVLVFCVLWFCCDFLYLSYKTYHGDSGMDIDHTYRLVISRKPSHVLTEEQLNTDDFETTLTYLDRLRRYPGIEAIALIGHGMPYMGYSMTNYSIDSMSSYPVKEATVSSGFFEVFRIPIEKGSVFDWLDPDHRDHALISPLEGDKFGSYENYFQPIGDIRQVKESSWNLDDENHKKYQVVGTTGRTMEAYNSGETRSTIYMPIPRRNINIHRNYVVIRVSPEIDRDFADTFMARAKEQLTIGPYYLSEVIPYSTYRKKAQWSSGAVNKLNGIYSVTGFIVFNVFLGILGTFWFRTQSRRGQIGLRIALGSSGKRIRSLFIGETLVMLTVASIVGTLISLNLSKLDLLENLGLPMVNRTTWGIGWEQDLINVAITFGFLALISVAAVWYPSRQASKIQPAEALHDE